MDERKGTKKAQELGLHPIGLVGVLIKAKEKGLISQVMPVLSDLKERAGFWLNESLISQIRSELDE